MLLGLSLSHPPPKPIEFVGVTGISTATIANVFTITAPNEIEVGDLMLMTIYVNRYDNTWHPRPTMTNLPSGWTELPTLSQDNNGAIKVLWKIATNADIGTTYSCNLSAFLHYSGGIIAYRNVKSISGIGNLTETHNRTTNIVVNGFDSDGETTMVTVLCGDYVGFYSLAYAISEMNRKLNTFSSNGTGLEIYDLDVVGDIPTVSKLANYTYVRAYGFSLALKN